MYDNERNNGLNIRSIIGKVLFLIAFVLLMLWLLPKVPNMTPFYSNVFRENISYMQNAAEDYFTNERLPQNLNEEVRLSLQEMIDKNLVLPFVDKDGNYCDNNKSYVSIVKNASDYTLKINLSCNSEENYIFETLGCYNKCESGSCTKEEKVIEYQFKKATKKNVTSCTCGDGYAEKDGLCYKSITSSKIEANKIYESDSQKVYDAILVEGKTETQYADYIKETGTTQYYCSDSTYNLDIATNTCIKKVAPTISSGGTYTTSYDATINKSCTTIKTTGTRSGSAYSYIKSQYEYTCSIIIQCPNKVLFTYYSYCTETPTCPSGGTPSGTKCIVTHTSTSTKNCSIGSLTSDGMCTDTKGASKSTSETTYSCPSGYIKSGSGTSTICSKSIKEADTYKCEKSDDLQVGAKCYRFIKGQFKYYECPQNQGYTLDGVYCYKTTNETKNKQCSTSTKTVYSYKWSINKTLSGWTLTGKTREVKNKI